jgi:hypothetical protein
MPLPHYSNVSSHNSKWEPVWKSLFEVTFSLPDVLNRTTDEVKLMLENATSINLPVTPALDTAVQRYKYSTRVFVGMPKETHIQDLSIKMNVNQNDRNSMFTWAILKSWYDLMWNSQTGETHVKADTCGTIVVNMHDKKGRVMRRVTYRNVQITELNGWDLAWEDTNAILDVDAKFVADYFEDIYLDR